MSAGAADNRQPESSGELDHVAASLFTIELLSNFRGPGKVP